MKTVKLFLLILTGNSMLMFGIAAFLQPTGIIASGTAGVGLIVQTYFQVPISTTVAVVNIICFLLGYFVLGWQFSISTLLSSFSSPIILRFFEGLPALTSLTDDYFLAAVLAGVLAGTGVGIVMRTGASTGGLDIPPLILQKLTGISVGTVLLVMSGIILTLQISFSSSEQILYGIVNAVLTSLTLDKVLMLGSQQAQLLIVSPKYDSICETLLCNDVGVTRFFIETGYTRQRSNALLCAVPAAKLSKIKALISSIDEGSFVLVSPASEIRGQGFTIPRATMPPKIEQDQDRV